VEDYDELLRGQDGSRDVIVDSHGRRWATWASSTHPRARTGLDPSTTTCSVPLNLPGAATAQSSPWTRATARFWPWFPAQLRSNESRCASIGRLEPTDHRPRHPLRQGIQAQLAPGSTFKILMSVRAAGRRRAEHEDHCSGDGDPTAFFTTADEHHGAVDIHNAIPFSCDTFFTCWATGWDRQNRK